jgi:hypothetical protein
MRMRVDDQQKERVMLNLGGRNVMGCATSTPLHSTPLNLPSPNRIRGHLILLSCHGHVNTIYAHTHC